MATSMIRPHPPPNPPPQRPSFLSRHTSDSLFDQHSPSPSPSHTLSSAAATLRNAHTPLDSTGQHQSAYSQMPLRYAHPLQRNHSYPPQDTSKEDSRTEHMLRRKTPNGILNAAYDGTSVEQTERPHAMKHILLPVTEQFPSGLGPAHQAITRDIPLRPPMQSFDSFVATQMNNQNGQWRSEMQFAPDPSTTWNFPQPQLPQIDSMLNQMPAHAPHLQYMQTGHHPFAFMPPTFQPSFGPTASNDTGPYGPYWPNGTFVPYRPAALRDMRYYPQTSAWAGQPIPVDGGLQNPAWYSVGQQRADIGSMGGVGHMGNMGSMGSMGSLANMGNIGHRPFPTQQPLSPSMHDSPIPQQSAFLSSGPLYPDFQTRKNNHLFVGDGPGSYTGNSPALRMPPVPSIDSQTRYDSASNSGQSTPTPRNYNSTSSPISEFGPGSSNAVLREKVFSWAHTIYIDLLKYLHGVRRRAQQNRHGGTTTSTGPNIYPRPPRQPSCDFSAHSSTHRSRSNTGSHRVPPNTDQQLVRQGSSGEASGQQEVISRAQNTTSWLPPGQSMGPSRNHHSQWHSQAQGYSASSSPQHYNNAHNQSRTLRRTSGNLHTTHPSGMRPEISHVTNATFALDSLAAICRNTGWKWVDGMLLGGCLAYALGDYQKAADWYSKILAIDSRYVRSSFLLSTIPLHRNLR
jgi:hypothetical protein